MRLEEKLQSFGQEFKSLCMKHGVSLDFHAIEFGCAVCVRDENGIYTGVAELFDDGSFEIDHRHSEDVIDDETGRLILG